MEEARICRLCGKQIIGLVYYGEGDSITDGCGRCEDCHTKGVREKFTPERLRIGTNGM